MTISDPMCALVALGCALCLSAACSDDAARSGTPWPVNARPGADDADAPDATRADADPADSGSPDAAPPDAAIPECEPPEDPTLDSDSDGLPDCQERTHPECALDANSPDTDRDGLTDYEELIEGTSPCDADIDRDGVGDADELRLGLDPRDASTYDEVPDAELFALRACDEPDPTPVAYRSSRAGQWQVALPAAVASFEERAGAPGRALFATAGAAIAGFIDVSTSSDLAHLDRALTGLNVIDSLSGAEWDAHESNAASSARWMIAIDGASSPSEVRASLLGALERGTAATAPIAVPGPRSFYGVEASVIDRRASPDLVVASVARVAAPDPQRTDWSAFPPMPVDPSSVAHITSRPETRCWATALDASQNAIDFYFVLDDSALRAPHTTHTRRLISSLVESIQGQSATNARIAFASTVPSERGVPRAGGPGWIAIGEDAAPVLAELDAMVARAACEPNVAPYRDSGYGFYAAREGLAAMHGSAASYRTRLRRGVVHATTVISARDDRELAEGIDPLGVPIDVAQRTREYAIALSQYGHLNVVVGGTSCGEDGTHYRAVASASPSGVSHHLCAAEGGFGSPGSRRLRSVTLPVTPIASSLRVELTLDDDPRRARKVSRSETDGYAFHPESNTIALAGSYDRALASLASCDTDAHCAAFGETCDPEMLLCGYRVPLFLAVKYSYFRSRMRPPPR